MSFGCDYGKDTGTYVDAVKNSIATMIAAIPEISIKDETNEFNDKEFKDEYEKICVKNTQPLLSKHSISYLCIIVIISKME